MSKLVEYIGKCGKYIGEYFLGTETHKTYKKYINFGREYFEDSKKLNEYLKSLKEAEIFKLGVSKGIPNLIALSAIVFSEPQYLIYSEIIRFVTRPKKDYDRLMEAAMKTVKYTVSINQKLKDISDRIDNQGEEWKDPSL